MSADKLDEITDRIVAYVASCVEGTSRNPVAFTRAALDEAVAERDKEWEEVTGLTVDDLSDLLRDAREAKP
jgi:hypothetical protein